MTRLSLVGIGWLILASTRAISGAEEPATPAIEAAAYTRAVDRAIGYLQNKAQCPTDLIRRRPGRA